MRTPKQIAASRANGARSKGPVTVQGKLNSSKNSTRHGMFADTLVLEKEDPAQLHELLDDLMGEHQPTTPTQTLLVETIVAARWRQTRIWGMQKVAFDADIASSADAPENPALRAVQALRTSPESIRSHELMLRYEIALDRQISRALLRLQQLQDRQAKRKEELIAPQKSENSAPAERTQQPTEEKQPATVAIANPGSTPAKPAPQTTSIDKLRLPQLPASALLADGVHFKRGRK
jgi:hypothetical protein